MICVDADDKNFSNLFADALLDTNYIGGLLAAPLKNHAALQSLFLSPQAKTAKAINCVYKEDGNFHGTIYDGMAALTAIYKLDSKGLENECNFACKNDMDSIYWCWNCKYHECDIHGIH